MQKKGGQPAVWKAQEDHTATLQPKPGDGLQGLSPSLITIFAVIFGDGIGDAILFFHPFRKAVSVGHKDNLHPSASFENALNQPCCSQAFIVRVGREDHKTCIMGDQRVYRQRFLCLGIRRDYYGKNE
jgi:hypothetical protein